MSTRGTGAPDDAQLGDRQQAPGEVVLVPPPVRVLISYAHDSPAHEDQVRLFWAFLRKQGIDARLDLPAAEQPQDWPMWMLGQIRTARFILIIASPAYRRRAEGDAPPDEGRGVRWESRLIRDDVYADPDAARTRVLPIVLPGGSIDDIPIWLGRFSSTHYRIDRFTVKGAERLLRVLTGQPYETIPVLGPIPVLPRRSSDIASPEAAELTGLALLRRLTDRHSEIRNEAVLQADVRQLLLSSNIGLNEDDLGAAPDKQAANRRRINIDSNRTVIEVRSDLDRPGQLPSAEQELSTYLADLNRYAAIRYVGILTDGVIWRLYQRINNDLVLAASLRVEHDAPKLGELLNWLEAILGSMHQLPPSPRAIFDKLGAESPAYALNYQYLSFLYLQHRGNTTVQVKRDVWAKLLTTASGSHFNDQDSLFVNHTLLVAIAKIIGHAVIGVDLTASDVRPESIMSGTIFADAGILNVIEADFFNWIVDVDEGAYFIQDLTRQLARFNWKHIDHDVLKILYKSIISPETRKLLGEHYTPDWLSEEILAACVTDPLSQRVLDPSCGSGTFLFHAIRGYLSASDAATISPGESIAELVEHVFGIDVHPVAVALARITYLLAIGVDRLNSRLGPFAVPVYLGDSLHWGQGFTLDHYDGVSIDTNEQRETFIDQPEFDTSVDLSTRLKFPDRVISGTRNFDELVNELADNASQRVPYSKIPELNSLFDRFAIQDDDRPILQRTFQNMCELHDRGRDHIWGYYVRNVARPAWLAQPQNRVDVLIGNPPWLAYRFMTRVQQASFRTMSQERGLLVRPILAPTQDLCTLFIVRCIEQYLKPGGTFGYVMPGGVLSLQQYSGLRSGSYDSPSGSVRVQFAQPWDLHLIKPKFFSQHVAVILGKRAEANQSSGPLTSTPQIWSGKFATETASKAEADLNVTRRSGERPLEYSSGESPYAKYVYEGATLVPHFLVFVEDNSSNPLGTNRSVRAVQSQRSTKEKSPWKECGTLHGNIERQFIRSAYHGESMLPFCLRQPAEVVIPWDDTGLLKPGDGRLERYSGLAKWWHRAEQIWRDNRTNDKLALWQRIDYHRAISQQLPGPSYRVAYNKSGKYLCAAVITDRDAVIEQQLCWGETRNLDEARYLLAILNSDFLTLAIRPYQARGESNPRHFGKLPFSLPIPPYDYNNSDHEQLTTIATRAEQIALSTVAAEVNASTVALRGRIRDALVNDGVAAAADELVKRILMRPSR